MTATKAQIKYIDDILEAGCPVPEHPQFDRPDNSMYDSFEAADTFIKKNKHWGYRNAILYAMSARMRMDEYGDIPNC